MNTYKTIGIETVASRHSYHDITDEINKCIEESGIKEGYVVINVPHTTCSIFFEEYMHDHNYFGDEFLQVDINEALEKIAPYNTTEGQYHSPGPEHIAFGTAFQDPNYPDDKWTMLNTDAHIKASMFGAFSETVIVQEGKLNVGPLGKIYFADWDVKRERSRKVNLLIVS